MTTPSFEDFRSISSFAYTPWGAVDSGSVPPGWSVPPTADTINAKEIIKAAGLSEPQINNLGMDVLVKDGAAVLAFSGTDPTQAADVSASSSIAGNSYTERMQVAWAIGQAFADRARAERSGRSPRVVRSGIPRGS